jgi:3-dehydroquinate synthase
MERLTVTHPGGQYDVIVGIDLLSQVRQLVGIESPLVVVTDSEVGPLYAGELAAPVITIPAGEQHKNLDTVSAIYDQMLALGVDRQATIVALGGGVVGDVAGFVAATYMRGLHFVQCPTTLLAMVDASVGGKTGVDLPQGKNLVGAFKQPLAVIADLTTLQSLPAAEFAAGMAEVVKHGLIVGGNLWGRLARDEGRGARGEGREEGGRAAEEQGGREEKKKTWAAVHDLQSFVVAAIKVKRDVVESDPYEQGRRAILNLGHTFGHAIEQVSGYRVRHGEAVAMGLVAAANLSARLEFCPPALQGQIEAVLQAVPLPVRIPAELDMEQVYVAMGSDKKKAAGKLRFVLLRDVGDVFVTGEVERSDVMKTLVSIKESGV